MAEVFRTLHGLHHLSALSHDDLPAAFFLGTSEAHASLPPATMSRSSSSSHSWWQGAARWKQSWNVAWKGWDDSSTATSPISESIPDKRVTNAPHVMQDQFSRTMPPMIPWRQPPRPVIGRQRQSGKCAKMPRCYGSRDGMQRNHQEHSLRKPKRSRNT